MTDNRASVFDFGAEFQAYLREHGVAKAAGTYTTWLNRVTRRIDEKVSPALVGRLSQVEPLIDRVKKVDASSGNDVLLKHGTPDESHLRSVLRKYAAMVQSNYRGLFASVAAEPTPTANDTELTNPPAGVWIQTYRVVRDTLAALELKRLYEFRCQLCDTRLEREAGVGYAEAHHLQPLGGEHKGPDVKGNLLCVCPNCHVLLDYNVVRIDVKQLRHRKHEIGEQFVRYHNQRCG